MLKHELVMFMFRRRLDRGKGRYYTASNRQSPLSLDAADAGAKRHLRSKDSRATWSCI